MNIDLFKEKSILVVGDVMLDKYRLGVVEKLSPEAPVVVVKRQKEYYALGGAANVANNIISLKGNVYLAGVIGVDEKAKVFIDLLREKGIQNLIVCDELKETIVKERTLAQYPGHPYQQILRWDEESSGNISVLKEKFAVDKLRGIVNLNCIVLSEYGKGFLTRNLVNAVKEIAGGKTIIVNAKPSKIDLYKNLDWIIFNTSETEEVTKMEYVPDDKSSIRNIGAVFIKRYNPEYFLMTAGSDGMFLYHRDNYEHIKTTAREVADVSGAGDTVAAALSLALASGFKPIEAARIANCAAGIVVEKRGTATASLEELTVALERNGISKP